MTTSQIEDFIGKLRTLLLLDEPRCWAGLETYARRRRRLDSLLSYKIRAFNPDALLTRMEKKLSFLFGRCCTAMSILSIAAAIIISILNWRDLFLSWTTLFNLYSIPLIVLVAFAVMTIHEFAHGLTLKHLGGNVEEMGFLLLYFFPAFYCNVSDAWMLGKRGRLLVTFAGGYVQLLLWAGATILWRLIAPETLASRICLITIAFSGVITFFNFNPLIRLDGYYLLSDYLEIPSLRPKAFRYIKSRLAGMLLDRKTVYGRFNLREKRIFWIYGVSAFVFSTGLVLIMLERAGGWMVREFQTWGLVLFSMICLILMPAAGKDGLKSPGKLMGGIAGHIKKAPRLLIIVLIVAAACFLPWELKISGDFTIIPSRKVEITPQVEGTLKAIRVDQGDHVKRGDLLAEMENLDLSSAFEDTKGELASKRASLDLLKAGTRPEEIARARKQVETKRAELQNTTRVDQEKKVLRDTVEKRAAELENARKNYERSLKLSADGLIAKNEAESWQTAFEVQRKELEEAQGQLKVLDERTEREKILKQKELEQAQSELAILLAGTRQESIRAVEAEVSKLQEKLDILSLQLAQLEIRAPIDGVVATPYLRNRLGEYMEKGDSFCEIVDDRTVILEMPVPEKEIADVHIGYPIVLKIRGFPKMSFTAGVRSMAPVAMQDGLERKVAVYGDLSNPEGLLKAGMTGVGKILCGKRLVGQLVTRRAVRWLRTEFWEYLP